MPKIKEDDRIRAIWTGVNRRVGVKKERMATKKYGDAILSSGPITVNKKEKFGYKVWVPTRLIERKPTPTKTIKRKIGGRGIF